MSARPPGGGAGTRSLRTVAVALAAAWPHAHQVPGRRRRDSGRLKAGRRAEDERPVVGRRRHGDNFSFPDGRTVSSFVPVNVSASTAVGAPGTFAKLSAPGSAM